MIRFATNDDINELKLLFKECFDVDFCSPYGVFYISNIFENYKPLVYLEEDRIVSMITLFPVNLITQNSEIPGLYLWGLGTFERCRGKGIATKILDFVEEYSKKTDKYFNILIPEEKKEYLKKFYFKRGFEINVNYRIKSIKKEKLAEKVKEFLKLEEPAKTVLNSRFLTSADSEKFRKLRRHNFEFINNLDSNNLDKLNCDLSFVEWGRKELKLVQKDFSLLGSSKVVLDFGDFQYCVLDLKDQNKLRILEFFVKKQNFPAFLNTLLNQCRTYEFFEFAASDSQNSEKYLRECFGFQNNNNINKKFDKIKDEIKNVAMLKPIFNSEKLEDFAKLKGLKNIYFNFGL